MPFPGLGNVWQLVLKESALISVTGLVELLRQSQIARRLDAPPVRLLHHRRSALPPHHLGLDVSCSRSAESAFAARRPEGGLMDFAFMRDTFFTLLEGVPLTLNLAFTSVALGADASPCCWR